MNSVTSDLHLLDIDGLDHDRSMKITLELAGAPARSPAIRSTGGSGARESIDAPEA